MRAKEMIIDFLNYIFLLLLIIFCITYFIVGDRIKIMAEFMKMLIPFAYFGIALLIKMKFSRSDLYKRKKEDNLEIVLNLSYYDKIKDELIVFLLPVIILFLAFFNGKIDLVDILQASCSFIIMYLWHMALFKKTQ